MALGFGDGQFDVVVSLEVLTRRRSRRLHRQDRTPSEARRPDDAGDAEPAGSRKAQQRRAARAGNLRKWFDTAELRALVQPHFNVLKPFSVAPQASRSILRIVNSERLNKPIRLLFGNRVELLKERLGLGWVLMLMGRKQS